jgi:orotate phosphoribosyltransferase
VSDRDDLLRLIKDKAVVHGDFVLSSGQHATWYIDLRRILLNGTGAALAGRVMRELTASLDYDAVGGLTLGADPVSTAMMHTASQAGQSLDAFVVRKEGKAHGLQRRIEGPDVAGRRVLAVEDTSTTGNSVLTAVEALREAGAEVVGVAVIVERGARPKVTARGLPFFAAYDMGDLGLDLSPAWWRPGACPPAAASRRTSRSRYSTNATMARTATAAIRYPATAMPCETLCQVLLRL